MNKLKAVTLGCMAALCLYSGLASADSWWEYRRMGFGQDAPYITYSVYYCYDTSGGPVCEFRYTTVGINPDL